MESRAGSEKSRKLALPAPDAREGLGAGGVVEGLEVVANADQQVRLAEGIPAGSRRQKIRGKPKMQGFEHREVSIVASGGGRVVTKRAVKAKRFPDDLRSRLIR